MYQTISLLLPIYSIESRDLINGNAQTTAGEVTDPASSHILALVQRRRNKRILILTPLMASNFV